MIRVTTTGNAATVTFPYDAAAVAIIKTVPGHRWNPTHRQWTIDHGAVRAAAHRLHAAGFDVTINGHPYSPTQPSTIGDPLAALFEWLPAQLRTPAYKALARALHPDAGGDTALMQQLNAAHKETAHR